MNIRPIEQEDLAQVAEFEKEISVIWFGSEAITNCLLRGPFCVYSSEVVKKLQNKGLLLTDLKRDTGVA